MWCLWLELRMDKCFVVNLPFFWDSLGVPWVSPSHWKAAQTFCQAGLCKIRRTQQVAVGLLLWELEGKKVSITWRSDLPDGCSWGQAHKYHKGFCVAYRDRNVSLVQVLLQHDLIISSQSSTVAICYFPGRPGFSDNRFLFRPWP